MSNFIRFSLFCLCFVAFAKGRVYEPNTEELLFLKAEQVTSDLEQWFPHIMDFMELMDISKLILVALEYMNDPEVLSFAMFATSHEFSALVYQFESMEEFKEAFELLSSKGYNVKMLLDLINSALNLPPIGKPSVIRMNKKGISGLLHDLMAALPIEDFKKLFQNKLETSKEVAELFETINSEEFVNILKKMSQNPKFKEFKETFESYGFEFEIICDGAKEVFGEYYQGIFC